MLGGCDPRFRKWGFEETTLAAKLIAIERTFVIPAALFTAIHVWDSSVTVKGEQRSRLFKEAHAKFERYLDSTGW